MLAPFPSIRYCMSQFCQELNAIDSTYVKSQDLIEEVVSDASLDGDLAAAVRHSNAQHNAELRWLLKRNLPLLFLVEFLGAPEKSSTLPTRMQIFQRWNTPTTRPTYIAANKDRVFYLFVLLFGLSIAAAIVFSIFVQPLFGMWSAIALLTVALFALIADVASWWNLRLSSPTVASVSTGGNTLSERVRETLAGKKDLRKGLSFIEPSEAHLLTHWSGYELRAILSAKPAARKKMFHALAPSFTQMQMFWATQCSYPLYLAHMIVSVFPYSWSLHLKKLNKRLP